MNMSKRIFNNILIILALCCVSVPLFGQADGAFSPYSIFGVGDIGRKGSAYNMSMGGVGIANRNNRFMNTINPASITERDSLSFMADFSLYSNNKIFKQKGLKSVDNVVNIYNIAFSFPVFKNTAMMVGITPYSNTGFYFTMDYTDPNLIGNTGSIDFKADGRGSIYKTYAAFAATFFKRLSIGAEMDIYFGNLEKVFNTTFNDASYNSISNTNSLTTSAIGAKFGVQYEHPLGNNLKLTLAATYDTGANLRGYFSQTRFAVGTAQVDTLYKKLDTLAVTQKVRLASEIGLGVSIKSQNHWMAEFNYTRSDWRKSNIDAIGVYSATSNPFQTSVGQSFRLGFEFIPNINDIRYYFNTASYRIGAYYKDEHYMLNNHKVTTAAITCGVTLPVYRWYNGLTFGIEFGRRGLSNQNIKEDFINFSIGFNLFDIWFQKPHYE